MRSSGLARYVRHVQNQNRVQSGHLRDRRRMQSRSVIEHGRGADHKFDLSFTVAEMALRCHNVLLTSAVMA